MCVIAVVAVAPCQCFSPGANQTTSPGRISSITPPSPCAHPKPELTISVWPNGCVCHAVRAPGSNVTLAPRTRAGSGASNNGSIRTLPVNHSAAPFVGCCEPALLISIYKVIACIGLMVSALQAFQNSSFRPLTSDPLVIGHSPLFCRTFASLDEIHSPRARRRPLVRPSFDKVQINHLVGSHCHGFTPLR